MKTANNVFADFCDCIEFARDDMGISAKWKILARNSQAMVNEDMVVLIDKIAEVQKGFQNQRFAMGEDSRLHEYWEWIEEYTFQISCVRERRMEDSPDTVVPDDVAILLKSWLNSDDGAAYLRRKGLAPLLVKSIVPQQYTSENEIYQKFVHFDVIIQSVQVIDRTPPVADAVYLGVKHYPLCNEKEAGDIIWERIAGEEPGDELSGNDEDNA